MKAIPLQQLELQQPKKLSEKERKGLIVITPILIGATAYGAGISYWIFDHIVRFML